MNALGAIFGCYELLKTLGFVFLHPLQPLIPPTFQFPSNIEIKEAPNWLARGMHYHTQHPLELTEFLNGFGISTEDEASWKMMIPEFESYAEWLVANKQNRLEWLLLWAADWDDFANGQDRQNRLKTITSILHDFGIAAGADMPIAGMLWNLDKWS